MHIILLDIVYKLGRLIRDSGVMDRGIGHTRGSAFC